MTAFTRVGGRVVDPATGRDAVVAVVVERGVITAVGGDAEGHRIDTDELVRTADPVCKVTPPLRALSDVGAVRAGLADGTLDAIATDHAPHSPRLKAADCIQAPFGMLGLETSLALTLTQLVHTGELTLAQAVAALSTKPARAWELPGHGGPIAPGQPANLVVSTLIDDGP